MQSYGIWDLIYRYLLPDWWVIPVYTTITAWMATVAWWRRAQRLGRDWARRFLVLLEDGPRLRLYAFRAAVALPFFLVPLAIVVMSYLLGCGVWAAFHDGQVGIAPNAVNLAALAYGTGGVVLVAWAYKKDIELFLGGALWYGAVVGIPWGLLALVNLLFAILDLLTDALFGTPEWGRLWHALGILAVAVVPSVTLLVAGWSARKGWDLITGRWADEEDHEPSEA
ncbi:MAG TPA: hypothetical protein VFB84_09135 [Micromonosporaceae bacterium]|nr:hypothetical protein [Micromonosporaceae bacterium]